MFNPLFEIGDIVTNADIMKEFQCGNSGGMRRSIKTDSLILITDHTKGLYDDIWYGDILHYTGMGKSGNQSLDYMQNKTLCYSNHTSISIFLFEVIIKTQYTFRGQVKLFEPPYQSKQKGEDELERAVWVFPLAILNNAKITSEEFEKLQTSLQQSAKKIPQKDLRKSAIARQQQKPSYRMLNNSKVYVRDSVIARYAKERAAGICQLCAQKSPFQDKSGEWYLENHHIEWLSCGGGDTLENTIALCPNCHTKMHILNLPDDIVTLKRKNSEVE